MAKVLRGEPLLNFISNRKREIERCNADADVRRRAAERLDKLLATNTSWNINRSDIPSLPNLPTFCVNRKSSLSYSNIPVPAKHRHLFKDRIQHTNRWAGKGISAWCDYLAHVESLVRHYADPPEAVTAVAPRSSTGTDLDRIDQLKRRNDAEILLIVDTLLRAETITGQGISKAARTTLRAEFEVLLGYLGNQGRTRVDQISDATLMGFRNHCVTMLRNSKRKLRTVNGYLKSSRRILGLCIDYCEVTLPRAYKRLLCNISKKELASIAKISPHSTGTASFGVSETVALPMNELRAWLNVVRKNPFDYAITMCSLNLAAGASDLSELVFEDRSNVNPSPCVDMDRKLFITNRVKTLHNRYTMKTDRGEKAIPMMPQTYEALTLWLSERTHIIAALEEQKSIAALIERNREAHRMKKEGLPHAKIAEVLGVAERTVSDILRKPTNRKSFIQKFAQEGYNLDDIVAMTGFTRTSVYNNLRGLKNVRKRKPHPNRYTYTIPDPNRVFFVPATGRPLVNKSGSSNYVSNMFKRICDEAGIIREVDIVPKKIKLPEPRPFILPRNNGHYIFRRTAATVVGMLGGVPERRLQDFLGHKNPEMTRKYVLGPPDDYEGPRVTHTYNIKITHSDDPIQVLTEFMEYVDHGR